MGKKKRDLYGIRSTAYHEAGHVVACLIYNIKFDSVFIGIEVDTPEDPKPNGGLCKLCDQICSSPLETSIMYLCGVVSESKHNNMVNENLNFWSGRVDLYEFKVKVYTFWEHILCRLKYKSFPKTYHPCVRGLEYKLLITARKLIDDNWEQVCVVAEKLIEKQKLTYDDVIVLIMNRGLYYNLNTPERVNIMV